MDVHFLDDSVSKFLSSLEKQTVAKVLRTLDLLEKFGNRLGMPHSKSLKNGLFELRIRGAQEVRIIYIFHRGSAVLLHGFVKKTNKISNKDYSLALEKLKFLD